MQSFWTWLILLALSWTFGLIYISENVIEMPSRIGISAIFFVLYFVSPLIRSKPTLFTFNLVVAAALSVIAFWPQPDGSANPYLLLVLTLQAGKAIYRLPLLGAVAVCTVIILGLWSPSIFGLQTFPLVFIILYVVILAISCSVFRMIWNREEETQARNEALLSEYRSMKRRIATDEELARQEERAQIGREIHDSVGHKLTALLMQLEVFRMKEEHSENFDLLKLKALAQESLDETRSAVKALRTSEPGGLSAILRLIRQLEAESLLRIHFTVKHGALSASLSNEQAVAIYRAVQEGMTNIMKHGPAREAEVMFEAPGGSVFRFEVSNPRKGNTAFREGFGLTSMRERLEHVEGQLEILASHDRFILRGTVPLNTSIRRFAE